MSRPKGSFWTDEKIAELQKLWGEGHTASEVARILDAPSRNSILSKVHRMGMNRQPGTGHGGPRRPRGPDVVPRRQLRAPKLKVARPARPQKPGEPPPAPKRQRLDVPEQGAGLTTNMARKPFVECCWPDWPHDVRPGHTPGFSCEELRVCGRPVPPGPGPQYCAAHASIAFQPLKPRTRATRPRPVITNRMAPRI